MYSLIQQYLLSSLQHEFQNTKLMIALPLLNYPPLQNMCLSSGLFQFQQIYLGLLNAFYSAVIISNLH